ncbi:UNVERIFIED_CONTAM: hypothetical protein GTU68_028412 [Idotea baltica]|nr:hypothetical protein [Idotea baltica]
MAIKEAFHIATTGRPGPVLVDIPKDIVDAGNPAAYFDFVYPTSVDLPGYSPVVTADDAAIDEAVALMLAAERPVLYVGGGVLKSRGAEVLRKLAEMGNLPVVTTLMARGAFPDSHELCLGMPGMHGNYTAVTAIQQSDLLIAMGSRFDDRVTGKVGAFAPDAKVIHVDIDPAEHGKVRMPDVSIVGDCRVVMESMVAKLEAKDGASGFANHDSWRQQLSGWQEKFPLVYDQSEPGEYLKPQFVLEKLRDLSPADTIVASGVGQHQMWASQYWEFNHPYTWINSGGLGTMGFSIPAAIGAKAAYPDRTVWSVDGDGCFQMTAQELITATVEKIPIKVAAAQQRSSLGIWFVSGQDDCLHHGRALLRGAPRYDNPDYVKVGESMGLCGLPGRGTEEVEATIAKANEIINDRPWSSSSAALSSGESLPMVPAGGSNDDIMVDPSQSNRNQLKEQVMSALQTCWQRQTIS